MMIMMMMMMMIMLLTLFVEEYTYGKSIEEYKNATLYNCAKYSLSNHVNDRRHFRQQQPHTRKTYLSVNTNYTYRLSLYFSTCYTKGGNKLTWICWLTLAPGEGGAAL